MTVRVDEIRVGPRHRRELGDVEELARSIRAVGLLQPVGVRRSGEGFELLFGARRLEACRRLGREEIEALLVDIEPDAGERAEWAEWEENEIRKDLAPSERVALAEALRSENIPIAAVPRPDSENIPKPTVAEAAKRAGFGNQRTFRDARKVGANGTESLRRAMDAGRISVSAAARLADLPPQRQDELVAGEPRERREAVRSLRAGRGDPENIPSPGDPENIPSPGIRPPTASERIGWLVRALEAFEREARDAGVTAAHLRAADVARRETLRRALASASGLLDRLAREASPGAGAPAWEAYAAAYLGRYGVPPVRNARVNAQMALFASRVPGGDAPAVAAFYVGHPGAWYARAGHAVGQLLADAEKLHMEWRRGRPVTAAGAARAERSAANVESSLGALELLRESGHVR